MGKLLRREIRSEEQRKIKKALMDDEIGIVGRMTGGLSLPKIDNMSDRKELMRVSLGKEPSDLVVKDGNLVNVYSGELLENISIAIKGDKIAYVGRDIHHTIGEKTEVIDASGNVITPGFIDAHCHPFIPLEDFLEHAMPHGTTALCMELKLGHLFGYEAALYELGSMEGQPIHVFGLASIFNSPPPFIQPEKPALALEDYKELLARDDVVALGESYWTSVIEEDSYIHQGIEAALRQGKRAEGHGSGAKGRNLAAFAASGVSSCHESVDLQEALDRLRLGLYVMIREGSIRRELEAISKIKDMNIDYRRMCLVTDGISGEDLLALGHMDYVLQKAINLGMEPIKAIQMVTINPAEHFGLEHKIGGIAPGRHADIVILPSLTGIECECVICKGKIVARDGKALIRPKTSRYPQSVLQSMKGTHEIRPEQLRVVAGEREGQARVRVIQLINNVITRENTVDMDVKDGALLPDPLRDILKVSLVDRENTAHVRNGFLQGFGLRAGAVASSHTWDFGSPSIVIGTDDQDMCIAVNRLYHLQGGLIVVKEGKILAELALPIGGFMPFGPIEVINRGFARINKILKELGCRVQDPFMTLQTLAGTSLPFFRITKQGLVDLRNQCFADLIV